MLDEAWKRLSGSAGRYLETRAGLVHGGARAAGAVVAQRTAFRARVERDGAAASRGVAALLLRLRHLEQVLGLWPVGPGGLPLAAERCLRAALSAAAHGWGASEAWVGRLRSLVSREAAAGLVELARTEYETAAARERTDRAAAWHDFANKDFRVGGRRVYRWIREPASVAPSPLVALDGVLVGGPAAELQAATTAWQPLWQRADAPPEEEAEWLGHLSGLPRFPGLQALTPQRVQEGINHLANSRAPGLDDWVGEELRLWPPQLVAALTILLVQVEALGRWPSGLQGAEVVLPPKPGGDPGDPLNRRPLNMLSVVYRLWARLRRLEVATWRKSWDPAVGAARLGASGQAWELAWAHAVARAKGAELGGLAVDFRKAYDTVRLGLVRRALLAAGWPAAVWGPVVAGYAAPRRLQLGPWDSLGCPLVAFLLDAPWRSMSWLSSPLFGLWPWRPPHSRLLPGGLWTTSPAGKRGMCRLWPRRSLLLGSLPWALRRRSSLTSIRTRQSSLERRPLPGEPWRMRSPA